MQINLCIPQQPRHEFEQTKQISRMTHPQASQEYVQEEWAAYCWECIDVFNTCLK